MKNLNEKYEMVPVTQISTHPENARKGNIERIAESIRVNGFYGALIVQKATKQIIAGNHRFLAATEILGMKELPVLWVDVDDDEARRMLLVDNRSNDIASYDDEALAALLKAAQATTGLEGTGYEQVDLDDLLMALEPKFALDDLADEWKGTKPVAEDGKATVVLALEEEVADEFRDYLKEVGDDTVAIKNLLARR